MRPDLLAGESQYAYRATSWGIGRNTIVINTANRIGIFRNLNAILFDFYSVFIQIYLFMMVLNEWSDDGVWPDEYENQ